jgi:DNA-binding beta-propeller fold protein YncE
MQLPVTFVRGFGADAASHAVYVAYGGVSGGGKLLKLDLLTDQVVYDRPMPVGVDSFDISPDGRTLYLPDGDGQGDGIWRVVETATGKVKALIATGGHNPHNTIGSIRGDHVYLGPRLSNYLFEADSTTNQVIRWIGPVKNGVRPFTIKSDESLAFIETSDFLGFQIANLNTGQIIHTQQISGFSRSTTGGFAPTHGISLSPDERELYIADWPSSYVHVFDVSGLPNVPPRQVADVPVHNMSGQDSPCSGTNCMKEGWLLHSRDGRFVYVGDAGDIIDTMTRKSIAYLEPLANTRKFIEIDWRGGVHSSPPPDMAKAMPEFRFRMARTDHGLVFQASLRQAIDEYDSWSMRWAWTNRASASHGSWLQFLVDGPL